MPGSVITPPRATPTVRGVAIQSQVIVTDPQFGADPSGVNDSTAAINAAYAYAQTLAAANGGAEVYYPAGTYLISNTVTVPVSNIISRGAGGGTSRILWKASTPIPVLSGTSYGGMLAVADYWNQQGNDIMGLTFDGNGMNGVTMPTTNTSSCAMVWAGSSVILSDIEVVNRPGSGTSTVENNYCILCEGHDIFADNLNIHDDYWSQQLTSFPAWSQTATSAAGIGYQDVVMTMTDTSGNTVASTPFQVNGHAVVDPNVNAFSNVALNAGTQPTITPHVLHENPWLNGTGISNGMKGIYKNQQLYIDFNDRVMSISGAIQSTFTPTSPIGSGLTASTTTANIGFTGTAGTLATATVTVNSSGAISQIQITACGGTAYGGTAYTGTVTLNTSSIPGTYSGPSITATVSGGQVVGIASPAGLATGNTWTLLTPAGSGGTNSTYYNVPFTSGDGNGQGCMATVVVASNKVQMVTLTNAGFGYQINPTLNNTLSAPEVGTIPGWSGTVTGSLTRTDAVIGYTITTSGSGTLTPTSGTFSASFTGGGGSGATATITVSAGSITGVTITNPGGGYTAAPTISSISGITGTFLITATLGSPQEQVTVNSVTTTTFAISAALTKPHAANCTIKYFGLTETAMVNAVSGNTATIRVYNQSRTAKTVCVVSVPFTSDGIGFGPAESSWGGITSHTGDNIIVRNSLFRNLGLDGTGIANCNNVQFLANKYLDCIVPIIDQDSSDVLVNGCIIDMSGLGQTPAYVSNIGVPGVNYAGITCYLEAVPTTYARIHVYTNNIIIGGSWGVLAGDSVAVGGNAISDTFVIVGNAFRNQGVDAIALSDARRVLVNGNQIFNPCGFGFAFQPLLGGLAGSPNWATPAGISLLGLYPDSSTSVRVTDNLIEANNSKMTYGTLSFIVSTYAASNIVVENNHIFGYNANLNASTTDYGKNGAAYYNSINAGVESIPLPAFMRNNIGFNPRGTLALSSGTTATTGLTYATSNATGTVVANTWAGTNQPVSGTYYWNTTGCDILLTVTAAGTVTAFTINATATGGGTALSGTSVLAVGQQFVWKPYTYLQLTASAVPTFSAYVQ